jgi:hypothetical protein
MIFDTSVPVVLLYPTGARSNSFVTVILCSRDTPIRMLLIQFFCIRDVLYRNIVAIVPLYLRDYILHGCVVIILCLYLRDDTRYGCYCCSSVFEIYPIRMLLQFFCIQAIPYSIVAFVSVYSGDIRLECFYSFEV